MSVTEPPRSIGMIKNACSIVVPRLLGLQKLATSSYHLACLAASRPPVTTSLITVSVKSTFVLHCGHYECSCRYLLDILAQAADVGLCRMVSLLLHDV